MRAAFALGRPTEKTAALSQSDDSLALDLHQLEAAITLLPINSAERSAASFALRPATLLTLRCGHTFVGFAVTHDDRSKSESLEFNDL